MHVMKADASHVKHLKSLLDHETTSCMSINSSGMPLKDGTSVVYCSVTDLTVSGGHVLV